MNLPSRPILCLTAAMIALLVSASFVKSESVTVSVESRAMSKVSKPFQNYMDAVIADQMRRGLTTGGVLNINAMDELDPVHYRAAKNRDRENDHDGDLGREHDDYMRDNGAGQANATLAAIGNWQQIADALPVIEAPSIVAEQPATEPVKTESEG